MLLASRSLARISVKSKPFSCTRRHMYIYKEIDIELYTHSTNFGIKVAASGNALWGQSFLLFVSSNSLFSQSLRLNCSFGSPHNSHGGNRFLFIWTDRYLICSLPAATLSGGRPNDSKQSSLDCSAKLALVSRRIF